MADIPLMEDHVRGLEAALRELRAKENLFHKAKGLAEEMEKIGKEIQEVEVELQADKEELAELQGQKVAAMQSVAEALASKISEVLPEGRTLLDITDDGFFLGFEKPDGKRVPYAGLSGGQKALFDQALCYALLGEGGHKVLIIEGAELDLPHLTALLEHLPKTIRPDTQVILNTYQRPVLPAPVEWNVVEVRNGA